MIRIIWMLLVAGCAAPQPVVLSLPPPIEVAPAPVPTPESPPLPPPVKTVAQQYQQEAQKEVEAVTAPDVTPEYIREVHTADLTARRALSALEARHRPTLEALNRAREAVRRLAEILDTAP